jgi:gliding motility-associated-like protein
MKLLILSLLILTTTSLTAQTAEKTAGCLDSLYIPTEFTPNGDTANDDFAIYFPCEPEKFEIGIYNRWGEEIFTSDVHNFRWDGTYAKGQYVSAGVYFYVVKFTYLKEEKQLTGNVNVIL